jgi:hypothetical protein
MIQHNISSTNANITCAKALGLSGSSWNGPEAVASMVLEKGITITESENPEELLRPSLPLERSEAGFQAWAVTRHLGSGQMCESHTSE